MVPGRWLRSGLRVGLAILCMACSICVSRAKTIMIVSPHPDDEALVAAGIIRSALLRGDTVKVVVVTNGDLVTDGYVRQAETVAAMNHLGLASSDIIFLGYGDRALMGLYESLSPDTVLTSPAGRTQTYANQGYGGTDYHNQLYRVHAAYTRANVVGDLQAALTNYLPSDIYTTSAYDGHPDHGATYLLLAEAIRNARKDQAPSFAPKVHEALVHWSGWPGGYDPANPFPKPPDLESTPLVWSQAESVAVPAAMQVLDPAGNQKYQTIAMYRSQACCAEYVKSNEVFWVRDFSVNLAYSATATASSEKTDVGATAARVIDGVIGSPWTGSAEWASQGQLAGAWVRLTWPGVVTVSQVILHDRANSTDNVLSGTLSFSDGSSIPVGPLPNNGVGLSVTFGPKTVTWVQFRVDSAVGSNIGLAEIEVQGPVLAAPALSSLAPASGPRGTTVPVTLTGSNFAVGATVYVSSPGITVSNTSVISPSQITADFVIAANAPLGARNVTVTTPAGTTGAVPFTVTSLAAPALSSITPSSGAQGSSVPVTIAGSNFVSGAAVNVASSGVTASGVTVVSPTQITATFVIAANAAAGATGVTVTTAGGTTSPLTFTVVPPAPGLSAIAPSTGAQGSSIPVTLTGTNFATGASVHVSSPGVTVTDVIVMSATRISATFGVAATAPLGQTNVTVTTPGGTSPPVVFNIISGQLPPSETNIAGTAAVTVSSESPQTGQLGIKAIDGVKDGYPGDYSKEWATAGQLGGAWIQLQWSAPMAVSRIVLYDRPNLTDNVLAGTLSFSDGTTVPFGQLPNDSAGLTITFPVKTITWVRFQADAATGFNIGLAEFEVFGAVAISPVPVLNSIAPATGAQGSSVQVTLTGANFETGASISVASSAVAVSGVSVLDSTRIGATFAIAGSAPLGAANVSVATSAGVSGQVPFTITPAPILTSISPASGAQGASLAVTFTGSGFDSGSSVNVDTPGVTVTNVSVLSATRITATVAIAADAAPGSAGMTISTAGGTSGPVAFTIVPAPPTLNLVAPASGVRGSTVAVSLTGSHFVNGAVVGVSAAGVTASNVTVLSSTQITATFTIAADAPLGAATVSVTTPGGTSGPAAFTILAAAPVLTSVAPGSGMRGATVPVTLTGSNFIAGATVAVANPGVTVSNVAVVSATRITANFIVASSAAPGAANVTVTTSGGTSGTVPFTIVIPAPGLTSISPASGVRNASVPVTLTGSNFLSGATVGVAAAGVTVSNISVVSATRITATLTIGATAPLGATSITVTTPGGTSGAVAFTILAPPPSLASIAPASGARGSTVAVTLTGSNFASGATVKVAASGVTVSNVAVVSGTQITASFSISTTATLGATTVTVTTAGGTSGTVTFTILRPAPTLTSISPSSGARGASVTVTLTGKNFASGATVGVSGSGVTVSNVSVASSTRITARFAVASNAATGARNVAVTTSGGTSGAVTFTVR